MAATSKRNAASPKRADTSKPRAKAAVDPGAGGAARSRSGDPRVKEVRAKPPRNRASSPEDFKTSILNIRVKDELKEQATATLEGMGISLAEAVRVFLGRVVSERAFPFPLHVPNAETAAALRASITSDRKRYRNAEEMFDDLERGIP